MAASQSEARRVNASPPRGSEAGAMQAPLSHARDTFRDDGRGGGPVLPRRLPVTSPSAERLRLIAGQLVASGAASPQMRSFQERRVRLSDGLTVAVKDWQPSGAVRRRVLALHGFLDNACSWDALVPLLDDETHVVAIDFPGHGLSGMWPGPFHFIDLIECVAQLIAALSWPQCVLLGHSLGGNVSVVVAATMPAVITGLILIEAWGPVTIALDQTVKSATAALQERLAPPPDKALVLPSFEHAIDRVRAAMPPASPVSDAAARAIAERNWIRLEDGRVQYRNDVRVRARLILNPSEEQVIEFIAAIECPVLLITGTKGFEMARYASDRKRREFAARRAAFKRLSERRITDGHHYLHFDRAAEVAAALSEFFGSHHL